MRLAVVVSVTALLAGLAASVGSAVAPASAAAAPGPLESTAQLKKLAAEYLGVE